MPTALTAMQCATRTLSQAQIMYLTPTESVALPGSFSCRIFNLMADSIKHRLLMALYKWRLYLLLLPSLTVSLVPSTWTKWIHREEEKGLMFTLLNCSLYFIPGHTVCTHWPFTSGHSLPVNQREICGPSVPMYTVLSFFLLSPCLTHCLCTVRTTVIICDATVYETHSLPSIVDCYFFLRSKHSKEQKGREREKLSSVSRIGVVL